MRAVLRVPPHRNPSKRPLIVLGGFAALPILLVVFSQRISDLSSDERTLMASLTMSTVKPFMPKETQKMQRHFTLEEQNEWIESTFRAADPSEQEWCQRALKTGTSWRQVKKGAQFGQDVFVARNLFLDQAMKQQHDNSAENKKKKKFYIESGANHYQTISGSYFFDKCLGWGGLCIEPNPIFHEDLLKKRSCTLVPKCLMSTSKEMMLGGMPQHRAGGMFIKDIPSKNNNNGTIPEGWTRVQCDPLHKILNETNSPSHIDLFVLDVEGSEFVVLESIDWDKVTFGALQIEDNGFPAFWSKRLDYDMAMRGYSKLFGMAIDSLYVKRATGLGDREVFWYPPDWTSFERNINDLAKGYQKTQRVAKPRH